LLLHVTDVTVLTVDHSNAESVMDRYKSNAAALLATVCSGSATMS